MKRISTICAVTILLSTEAAVGDPRHGLLYDRNLDAWTIIEPPVATCSSVSDIEGSRLVGEYTLTPSIMGPSHGFVYDMDADEWTYIDMPNTTETVIRGIEGNILVGRYTDATGHHGFYYNMNMDVDDPNAWTTLDSPWAPTHTAVQDISGSNLVGIWYDGSTMAGFVYDMTMDPNDPAAWTAVEVPPGWSPVDQTQVFGIGDSRLVGSYAYNDTYSKGFVYDMTMDPNDPNAWTELHFPGANHSEVMDVVYTTEGFQYIGSYSYGRPQDGSSAFVTDGTTWMTYDMPGAAYTSFQGFDCGRFVGTTNVPEPTTVLLLALGCLAAMKRRRRR